MAELLTHAEAMRFIDKIRLVPETGCWEWTGSKSRLGYGQVTLRNKSREAHSVMYEAVNGKPKFTVDHLCRNRACVRPRCFEDVPHRINVLRGIGPTAVNARKTHCIHGHEFTPENIRRIPALPGGRFCRECHRRTRNAARDRRAREARRG